MYTKYETYQKQAGTKEIDLMVASSIVQLLVHLLMVTNMFFEVSAMRLLCVWNEKHLKPKTLSLMDVWPPSLYS